MRTMLLLLVIGIVWSADRIGVADLAGKTAILTGENADVFLIRIEEWEVRSIDGLPRLKSKREVELPKTGVTLDADLHPGELIRPDGAVLRSFRSAPVIVVPGPVAPAPAPRAAKPAFKGMEMYSWRGSDSALRFSILVGTNGAKGRDMIMAPSGTIADLKALQERIGTLAMGEYLIWTHVEGPPPTAEESEVVVGIARMRNIEAAPPMVQQP
jgi:hypothetical protein